MKFIQKYWLPIILVLAVITSIVLNTSEESNNNEPDSVADQIQTLTLNSVPQCYLYEQGVGNEIPEGGDSFSDFNREYIEITITENGLATGQHLILPFESDANRANFLGISMDGYINVVATAQAEGATWQEQRVYKVEDDKLFVGYQEVFVPRYENENGIYLFEDINTLIFETNDFYLSEIPCSSVDRTILQTP